MLSLPPHGAARRPRTRRRGVAATSAAMIATLAALPTASAVATTGPSTGTGATGRPTPAVRPATSTGELTPGELQQLLSELSLNDLGAAQLAQALAGLEGVSQLAGLKAGLLGEQLGSKGLEQALSEAIEELKRSNPTATLGELTNLKTPLAGKLGGLLEALGLDLLLPEQQEALENELGSLNLSSLNLDELVGTLLKSTKPGEPLAGELSTLASGLFGKVSPEGALGSLLGGAELTFTPKSVQEVAEELETTPEAVSGELGQTAAQLPAGTTMLTAPLTKGKLAGLAPAAKGLVTGVLGDLSKATEGEGGGKGGEENEGSGKGSGNGEGSGKGSGSGSGTGEGKGGSGGNGSGGQGGPGGASGSTTVVLTLPGASTAPSAAAAAAAAAKAKAAKVQVLGHWTRGGVATVVLHVPAAGRITLSGRGVRATTKRVGKAGEVILRVPLSRAGAAALRRSRRRGVTVKLEVSFAPTAGPRSTATTTVRFA